MQVQLFQERNNEDSRELIQFKNDSQQCSCRTFDVVTVELFHMRDCDQFRTVVNFTSSFTLSAFLLMGIKKS